VTLWRVLHGIGLLACGALVALLIASYFLSRNCGEAEGADATFILVYIAPALAILGTASFKDKVGSTSVWLGLLVAAPLGAWFWFFIANVVGTTDGSCVGY